MIEVIQNPNDVHQLAETWNKLADLSKNPLLRYEWFAACAEAFCKPGQLCVLINKTENGIDSIAPLTLTLRRGIPSLELLGESFLGEPGGFICRDGVSLEESMNVIINMGRPVTFRRLRWNSLEVTAINGRKKSAFIDLRDGPGTPFLPITTSWTEFESSISSRYRYDLRRASKRAETFGDVQLRMVSPEPDKLEQYFQEIVQVEAAGWKGREGTALQRDGRLNRFFNLYTNAVCKLGMLRLGFLRINGQTAAVMLAVESYNRFWVLKIGYNEAFSRCSPGILLVHETIRYAFENKLEAYEFLGNDAPWIRMWTKQAHPCVTARIYPYSVGGQVTLGLDVLSLVVKRAARVLNRGK